MHIKPKQIRLDASTICQLKCPTCKTTEGVIAKSLGARTLKFENFKNLVDANPWIEKIELSSKGEIFLNRDLLQIIKYAYDKKIMLSADGGTNFNWVGEEMLEALVKYRFNTITCAIDGASSETYKIYRRGGDFDKVIANIKAVNKYKVQYRSQLPTLVWQFVPFGHNEHEILLAKKMALSLNMRFTIKIAWGDFAPVKNKEFVKKATGLDVTDRAEYREKYHKVNLSDKICAHMWLQPQINTDGRVLGCCENHWGDYGNAFKDDLMSLLNSEKMRYARDMLLGKNPDRSDIPCLQCPIYSQMKKINSRVFTGS
jgi:MoaA/NifB/PqqE/SkfB family radical SAM enzyme